ncbi:MAG: hypothetical protein LBL31_05625, partial [Spirochaetaceae bacterium]|nr:hypothetical protein [Spirochaetaceae bacterium]
MKKMIALSAFCFLAAGMVFAQNSANQYTAINGRWKNEKEALIFQFNPDGTFTMTEESEEARRAVQREQRASGESAAAGMSGTYTATAAAINMVIAVDGRTHRIRMSYKIIDA